MKKNDYILSYYQHIKDGTEIVGKWITLLYEYIIKGLESKAFFYDPKKADRAVRFIEEFGHHHEGSNGHIKLEPWQKALVACIFGLVDQDGCRQFQEIVISMGEGMEDLTRSHARLVCTLCG
jgi:Phage terminase-like protein, large subunit